MHALENHIHHLYQILSSGEEQAPNDFTLINATTYVYIISSLSLSCSVPKKECLVFIKYQISIPIRDRPNHLQAPRCIINS